MEGLGNGDSLLEVYLFETSQNTAQIEKIILDIEKGEKFSEDAINELFRIMHTVKGSSAMMSYSHLAKLAHKAEDLFAFIRDNPNYDYDPDEVSDKILAFSDYVNNELDAIRNNEDFDIASAEQLTTDIEKELEKLKLIDLPASEAEPPLSDNSFKAIVYFEKDCSMENLRAFTLVQDLEKHVKNISYSPKNIMDDDSTADTIKENGFKLCFESQKSYNELMEILVNTPFVKDVDLELNVEGSLDEKTKDIKIDLGGKKKQSETKKNLPEKASIKQTHKPVQSMISINVAKLDQLVDLIGEAVIAQSMVIENPDLIGLELKSFRKEAASLQKIIGDIQDVIMSMRLVPLTTLFQKMHRIVRDMSKKQDKEIQIDIIGEETEVDKSIIDHISDPMIHLVRNAVDHGIEPKSERLMNGKPAFGTVRLEAFNDGTNIYISVKDDGRGLDKDKLIEKAKKKNILKKNPEQMSDKEIFGLIFIPGFSTNDQVSEFSGRGVGMDVVMQGINAVGGVVTVDSKKGEGTSINMRIPLTVAIIDGMNLMVGNNIYTIPITSISEFFRVDESNIVKDTDGSEMVLLRDECISVMRLYKQFDITDAVEDLTEGIMVVVNDGDNKRCVFVDKLLGQQQVVVKSIPDFIKKTNNVKGFMGCTLLGDGSISLILDAGWLVNTDIKNTTGAVSCKGGEKKDGKTD